MLLPFLSLLLLASPTLSQSPSPQVPYLSYSLPKPLLGLEPSMYSHSPQYPAKVIFLPGFHSCGVLQIVSVSEMGLETLEKLKELEEGAVKGRWEAAEGDGKGTRVVEDGAREDEILEWAKGWKSSCGGKGKKGVVKVAKVEWESGDDEDGLKGLDAAITPYLPSSSTQHQLLLTSLSPSLLLTLFDLASPSSSSPSSPPETSPIKIEFPNRRRHSLKYLLVKFVMKCLVLVGVAWGVWKGLKMWRERKEGGVRLPMTRGEGEEDAEELDLEAE